MFRGPVYMHWETNHVPAYICLLHWISVLKQIVANNIQVHTVHKYINICYNVESSTRKIYAFYEIIKILWIYWVSGLKVF